MGREKNNSSFQTYCIMNAKYRYKMFSEEESGKYWLEVFTNFFTEV